MEELDAENNPEDPGAGTRKLPFSREIYIEQDDFREDPPKKFFRLVARPGDPPQARLLHPLRRRWSRTRKGNITELRCTYDPESRGGWTKDGRKVLGTSHWVSAAHAVDAEVRLYDKLLSVPDPAAEKEEKDFKEYLNPASLEIVKSCKVEPEPGRGRVPGTASSSCARAISASMPTRRPEMPVFNRSVTLRDSWAKIEKSQQDK